jgi:CelD/BcsL family acetyltransferase involved in cellulose biosynthesis
MNYQIKTSRTFEDKELKKAWHELYQQEDYKPQSSYDWMSIWWKHFSNKKRLLFIVTIEQDDKIIGIGPFMIERLVFFSQLKMIGSGLTDFHEILTVPEKSYEIIQCMIDYISSCTHFDLINLEQIPDYSKAFNVLDDKAEKREMIKCPVANFNSTSWDEFKAKLSKNSRKRWVNSYNRLSKLGTIKLEKVRLQEEKTAILEELFKMHTKRWDVEGYLSKLRGKLTQEFLVEIFSRMNESCIYLLRLNDHILSYNLGFMNNRSFFDWNGSFDPNFSNYSPGMILTGLIFKYLIERNYTKCNFMRGSYEFKRRWMTDEETITNYQFLIPNTCIKGGLGVQYYMKYKWWFRRNLFNVFDERRLRKMLNKLKY